MWLEDIAGFDQLHVQTIGAFLTSPPIYSRELFATISRFELKFQEVE